MAFLFISYRVATAAPYVSRLNDWLVKHFDQSAVFYDRATLHPGDDWRSRLRRELKNVAAVLAIIDRQWLASFVDRAKSDDIVRFELETAIALGKPIMPLLVGGYRADMKKFAAQLPPSLQSIMNHNFHTLDDTTPAMYETSIKTLIAAIERLDASIAAVEQTVVGHLLAKEYATADRLLVRQPPSAHRNTYLALARLAGRSFNALYPAERETIEALLLRAQTLAADWDLPKFLLAIIEIDFYELNGIVSTYPAVSASDVRGLQMGDQTRALLSNLYIGRRARRVLGLDTLLSGATR